MNALIEALELLLARYVELVESGDCGSWDPESEEAVQRARAALAEARALPDAVTVLIPVLNRPERVLPVLESLGGSDGMIPVFLCSPGDHDEVAAVEKAGLDPVVVSWKPGRGDYARKMNLGFGQAVTTWVFLGADDLLFHAGWAKEAIRVATEKDVCVIGTNDLGNQRTAQGHSTHSLVHRDYLECGTADEDGKILHEGYDHNFVDDEFIGTARDRGTYAHAPKAVVEHLHPNWGKAVDDATYRKGMRMFRNDRDLYNKRCRLWGGDAR